MVWCSYLNSNEAESKEKPIDWITKQKSEYVESLAKGLVAMLKEGIMSISQLSDSTAVEVRQIASETFADNLELSSTDLQKAASVFMELAEECATVDSPEYTFGKSHAKDVKKLLQIMHSSELTATYLTKAARNTPIRNVKITHLKYANEEYEIEQDLYRLELFYRTVEGKTSRQIFELDIFDMKNLIKILNDTIKK